MHIGTVQALFRYPVKSMAGEPLERVELGWHGLEGDRRLAFRRIGDRGGFPWLTASRVPELILYAPERREPEAVLPSHVRTPEGRSLDIFGEELSGEIERRHGSPVEMLHLDRGIFDEASVSVITTGSVAEIARLSSRSADVRRFRPNVVIAPLHPLPFLEDTWVTGTLTFGEGEDCAAVSVTNRDERCAMVNYDPDSARTDPEVLKTIVRERSTLLGVYGATARRGQLAVGQPVFFHPSPRGSGQRPLPRGQEREAS